MIADDTCPVCKRKAIAIELLILGTTKVNLHPIFQSLTLHLQRRYCVFAQSNKLTCESINNSLLICLFIVGSSWMVFDNLHLLEIFGATATLRCT